MIGEVTTILAISIYAVKKKVHLLTRNVQITAYKQLNTWYDLPGPQLRHSSFWAWIRREYKVLWGDLAPDLFFKPLSFPI